MIGNSTKVYNYSIVIIYFSLGIYIKETTNKKRRRENNSHRESRSIRMSRFFYICNVFFFWYFNQIIPLRILTRNCINRNAQVIKICLVCTHVRGKNTHYLKLLLKSHVFTEKKRFVFDYFRYMLSVIERTLKPYVHFSSHTRFSTSTLPRVKF